MKHCRNGNHLRNCSSFACSGSFKCRLSYCIPTHRVCNGVMDCPYGDDEQHCPLLTCPSMLRCSTGICIHPKQICDGVADCMNGEDELVCEAPRCPAQCQCLGHALSCTGVEFGNISHDILYNQNINNAFNTFYDISGIHSFACFRFVSQSACRISSPSV